jgi:hypothetical protein
MSDIPAGGTNRFLTQMVARASDRANVVRPRLPGLFEPVSPPRLAAHAQALLSSNDDWRSGHRLGSRRSDSGEVDATDSLRVSSSRAEGPSASRARHADPVQPFQAIPSAAQSMDNDIAGNAKPIAAQATRTAGHTAPHHRGRLQPAAIKPDFGPIAHGQDQIEPARRFRPASMNLIPDMPQAKPEHSDHAKATPLANALSMRDSASEKNTLTPKRVAANPAAATHDAALQTRRADIARARPEPTVHISIGRVEVRAQTQAVLNPQQRPSSSRRPMSLDEYLTRKERTR